jgi:HK97 family phage portal protein
MAARVFQFIKSAIANLQTKAASVPLSSTSALEIFAAPSVSGVAVTPETAMRCAAVSQAVRLISESVATLDCALYFDGPDGREPVTDHPVSRVLKRPNGWTGETEFTRQTVVDLLLHGAGLAAVSRVRGEVRELHRIDPRACTITIDPMSGEPSYSVAMEQGGTREFTFSDILHVKGVSVDGVRGLGIVDTGRETIALALLLEKHAATMFANGARPAGILEMQGRLDRSQLDMLKASFASIYGGASNSGKTLILESGTKFQPIAFASTDSQFLENRKFAVTEIARLLNLPPTLIGDLQAATFSNAESLAQQFLDRTITPLLEVYEEAMERALLTDVERDAGYCIEFDTENFARADTAARFAAYRTATEIGLFSVNEAREREGLPPVDGGDQRTRSVQTIPLDQPAPTPPPAPKTSKRTP